MGEIGHNTEAWQNAFCHVMGREQYRLDILAVQENRQILLCRHQSTGWLGRCRCLLRSSRGTYQEIRDARLDQETAKAALTEFIENSRIQQCVIQNEYIRSLGLKTQ